MGLIQMADLLKVSEEAVSGAERQKKALVDAMVKTGGDIVKAVHEMQLKEVQEQNRVLENQKTWDIITEAWRKSVFDFGESVKKLLGLETRTGNDANWNIISGSYTKDTLGKLSKKNNDYEIIARDKVPIEEGHLFFPLMELPEIREDVEVDEAGNRTVKKRKFFKYLKLNRTALEKLGYPVDDPDKMFDQQSNIIDILKNNPDLNILTEDNINKGTGQGGKGHTLVFNINAATRAGIHFELDNHLDALQAMSHPSKLANNF